MKCAAMCLLLNLVAGVSAGAQPLPVSPDTAPTESSATLMAIDDDGVLNLAEPDFVVVNLPSAHAAAAVQEQFPADASVCRQPAKRLVQSTGGQPVRDRSRRGHRVRVPIRGRRSMRRRRSIDRVSTRRFSCTASTTRCNNDGSMPVSISALASIEGTNNFKEKYAPCGWRGGFTTVRHAGRRLRHADLGDNTAASLEAIAHDHDGDAQTESSEATQRASRHDLRRAGRACAIRCLSICRRRSRVRVQGYAPDEPGYGVSIEKRVGAHMFSLTFTNTFAHDVGPGRTRRCRQQPLSRIQPRPEILLIINWS